MDAWLSLLKKEYRMTKASVLWGLVILIAAGFLDVYLAYHNHGRPGVATVLAVLVLAGHAFYLVFYLLRSLSSEWDRTAQIWLHLPQSGWSLLSAKLVSGFLSLLASFGITCVFTWWVVKIEINSLIYSISPQKIDQVWSVMTNYSWMFALLIILGSVYTGLWGMLISVAVASAKNVLGKGKWLIGAAIFLIPTWGMGALQNSVLYDRLLRWGPVNLPLTTLNNIEHLHIQIFYTGELIFYALIMLGIFYLSGWLLDHKVEV